MHCNSRTRTQYAATVLVLAGVLALTLMRAQLFVAYADPVGIQYTGAGACAAAACHGGVAQVNGVFNVNVVWNDKDPHSRAMVGERGLNSEKARAIARKLNIEDAAQANSCLLCHSTSALTLIAPVRRLSLQPNQHGNRFDLAEGVSCDACHGPAGRRIEPHVQAGWVREVQARGVQRMFDDWGMLALKDAHMRANSCVSCHLAISPALVDAGHPELRIELGDYSGREWSHWRDERPWFAARLWAVGQAVALRDATRQLSDRVANGINPERKKFAYQKLIAHALLTRQAARVMDPPALDAIDAQLKELNGNWDNNDRLRLALHDLYAVAEKFAANANAFELNAEHVKHLRAGVVAEAETAGTLGNFPATEAHCFSLLTLNQALIKEGAEEAGLYDNEVGTLFELGSLAEDFKAELYKKAALQLKEKIPHGKAIPLPPKAPQN